MYFVKVFRKLALGQSNIVCFGQFVFPINMFSYIISISFYDFFLSIWKFHVENCPVNKNKQIVKCVNKSYYFRLNRLIQKKAALSQKTYRNLLYRQQKNELLKLSLRKTIFGLFVCLFFFL